MSCSMLSITTTRVHVYICIDNALHCPSLTFLAWPLVTYRVRRNSERLMKETPDRPKQKLGKKAASSANLLMRSPSLERCDDVELSYDITIALCHCVRSVPVWNSFPLIGILGSVGVSGAQVWNGEVVWGFTRRSIPLLLWVYDDLLTLVPQSMPIFMFIVYLSSGNFVWGVVLSAFLFSVDFVSFFLLQPSKRPHIQHR